VQKWCPGAHTGHIGIEPKVYVAGLYLLREVPFLLRVFGPSMFSATLKPYQKNQLLTKVRHGSELGVCPHQQVQKVQEVEPSNHEKKHLETLKYTQKIPNIDFKCFNNLDIQDIVSGNRIKSGKKSFKYNNCFFIQCLTDAQLLSEK